MARKNEAVLRLPEGMPAITNPDVIDYAIAARHSHSHSNYMIYCHRHFLIISILQPPVDLSFISSLCSFTDIQDCASNQSPRSQWPRRSMDRLQHMRM